MMIYIIGEGRRVCENVSNLVCVVGVCIGFVDVNGNKHLDLLQSLILM